MKKFVSMRVEVEMLFATICDQLGIPEKSQIFEI